jgi:hypothetical protein
MISKSNHNFSFILLFISLAEAEVNDINNISSFLAFLTSIKCFTFHTIVEVFHDPAHAITSRFCSGVRIAFFCIKSSGYFSIVSKSFQ